jgi:hypothetical protein
MRELLKSNKVFMPGRDSYKLIDKGEDSTIGGTYYFYKNGSLQSYKFFGSYSTYTYNEEYDLKGKLVRTEGNPIVYRNIKEVGKDSAVVTYYIYAYNKFFFGPKILINDSSKVDLRLEDDTLYSNMLSASVGFNTKGLSFISLYLEVSYINHCIEGGELLKDTMTFSTYPRLEVVDKIP